MSDKETKQVKVEAQPLRALTMPEYRYQSRENVEHFGTTAPTPKAEEPAKPDLSQVTLNLA
jgi:hypothetical protein